MEPEKKYIDPMIFDEPKSVSTESNLIKPMNFDVKNKGIEEKIYIILYRLDEDDIEEYQRNVFSVCVGRTSTYNDIKEKLLSGLCIDVHKSKIITETKQIEAETGDKKYFLLSYDECISIYSFCVSVSDYYSNDNFNIEEFNNPSNEIEGDKEDTPQYLTKEQLEFKKLLEASMNRDKMFMDMKNDGINI